MSRVRINILANLIGQVWSTAMGLLFVPIFIRLIGVDGYGLVGLYASLTSMLQVLDLGLSPVMNREMARYSTQPERAAEARDFLRTVEVGYWLIGLVIAVALVALSPLLATQWIRSERLSSDVIRQALVCMAAMAALQWPLSLYGGGLLGLQRQVLYNGLNITMSLLSNVGAALVLIFISPTIIAFFEWQILVSALRLLALTLSLWWSLPRADRSPKIRIALVGNVWHFAAGMSALSVTSIILTQSDKLIISRVLGLEAVGYYTLAGIVASGVSVAISPVFNALFPRFSALVAAGPAEVLQRIYHEGSQIMAVLVMPVTAVLAAFSTSILLVWTGNAETARIVAPVASLLVIGTSLNGIAQPAYGLQLAHGTVKINLIMNCAAIAVLLPLTFLLVSSYGIVGAGVVWLVLNIAYAVVLVPLLHHYFLPGQTARWLMADTLPPALAALAGASLAKAAVPLADSRWLLGIQLLAVLTAVFAGACLITPSTRTWLQNRVTLTWHQLARP